MSFAYRSVPLEIGAEADDKAQSDTSSITLDGEEEFDHDPKAPHTTYSGINRRPPRTLWILHAFLFTLSLTLFILSHINFASTLTYVQTYSTWSPAAPSVAYSTAKYNLSTAGNRFVGQGPSVDKAWREISYDVGDQWISKEDAAHLAIPSWHLKVDNPRTGETGYRVGVEVFHQLHCLNLLRRVTYKDYYEKLGGELGKGPEALKHHTDHCIEVLRRQIMCSADIGLFSLYMVEGDPEAWPELNTNHVCRNFDGVRDWAMDHSVGNMEVGGVVNAEG